MPLLQYFARIKAIHLLIPMFLFFDGPHPSACAPTLIVQELANHEFLDERPGFRHGNTRRAQTPGLKVRVREIVDDGRNLLFGFAPRSLNHLLEGAADASQTKDILEIERDLVFMMPENILHGLFVGRPQPIIQDGYDRRRGSRGDVDPRWCEMGLGRSPCQASCIFFVNLCRTRESRRRRRM